MSRFASDSVASCTDILRHELDLIEKSAKELGDATAANTRDSLNHFFSIFRDYVESEPSAIDWDSFSPISSNRLVYLEKMPPLTTPESRSILSRLAVVRLNGGLGTTMGCMGPKSAIEVRDGLTFLDLAVRQIEYLNDETGADVPLIFFNSFNTHEETTRIMRKFEKRNLRSIFIMQNKCPRLDKDSMLPIAKCVTDPDHCWYPPGHGNVYTVLQNSGMLDKLLAEGRDIVFISNIDNLGATIDPRVPAHMAASGIEFLVEATEKTPSDTKGGTLVEQNGNLRVVELSQLPADRRMHFTKRCNIFNTNNLWVDLVALQRILEVGNMQLDVIYNMKTIEETKSRVVQLETAAGDAIRFFKNTAVLYVPRGRFMPVKNCSDLFLVQSKGLYRVEHGSLVLNPERPFATIPHVNLGASNTKISAFLEHIRSANILELVHLTICGEVTFGDNVTLKGTVIIVANHGCRIDIPSGAVLENKVVTGDLRVLDH